MLFQARFIIVFDLTLKQKCVKQYKQIKYNQSWNAYETTNKPNKIWLKELNLHISRNEWLNWSKISKWTNSKIHSKLTKKNIFKWMKWHRRKKKSKEG